MVAASTSETSVKVQQATRRNNPEDSHLHTRRCENLKSHYSSSRSTVEEIPHRLKETDIFGVEVISTVYYNSKYP
jgi:hypothetical protein